MQPITEKQAMGDKNIMPDLKGSALAALKDARKVSRRAVAEIQTRKKIAYNAQDYDEFEECASLLPNALNAEHLATQRLIAGIIDADETSILTLKKATSELDARIERVKANAAKLSEIAEMLSIVTNAVLLFKIV
jgi:hypothetical protein